MSVEVTQAKLTALRQALDGDHKVTFRNGTVVKRGSKGEGIIVEYKVGRGRIVYSFGTHGYEDAYRTAMGEFPHREKPRCARPFWFDPDKRRPPRPEWEECPF